MLDQEPPDDQRGTVFGLLFTVVGLVVIAGMSVLFLWLTNR